MEEPKTHHEGYDVVLFDGVCNLCNAWVNYVIDHDPGGRFRFASLQSEVGGKLAASHGIDAGALASVVLVTGGSAYQQSDAALRIAAGLRGPVSWLRVLRVVPRFLRDPVYRLIARLRYKLFGKREACRLPTPEDRARFLPDA